jgi:hypothetical protein
LKFKFFFLFFILFILFLQRREYRLIQIEQSEKVFRFIQNKIEDDKVLKYQICENFYSALEELSIPLPKNFATYFSKLGFECLPRK